MIRTTLLDIIEVNREALMQSSSMALQILPLIRKNYRYIDDPECVMSLALNESIARMVFHADYEGAIAHSRQVLARFAHTSLPYYTTRHLALIGRCLTLSGQFSPGEEALQRALEKIRQLSDDSTETVRIKADILHDLAMNNDMANGDIWASVRYLEKALSILDGTDFNIRKAICLMGLGNVNYSARRIEPALEYYMKAAVIFEEESNLSNLASARSNIGNCFTDLGKYKLAESHLNRSLHVRSQIGNPDEIAISYFNLLRLYEKQGDMQRALISAMHCRDYSQHSPNQHVYKMVTGWLESAPVER